MMDVMLRNRAIGRALTQITNEESSVISNRESVMKMRTRNVHSSLMKTTLNRK